jgi:hypothetical protein
MAPHPLSAIAAATKPTTATFFKDICIPLSGNNNPAHHNHVTDYQTM